MAKFSETFWSRIIYLVSGFLLLVVIFLIYGPRPEGTDQLDVSALPLVNATLNGITTVLLLIAYGLIRKRKIVLHRRVMFTAFGTSGLFLVSYVLYHWFSAGPTLYTGGYRGLYFFILITHIFLAAAIIPLALITLYRGWNNLHPKHRKIARWTLPIWLYVSVTGVVIYGMLYL